MATYLTVGLPCLPFNLYSVFWKHCDTKMTQKLTIIGHGTAFKTEQNSYHQLYKDPKWQCKTIQTRKLTSYFEIKKSVCLNTPFKLKPTLLLLSFQLYKCVLISIPFKCTINMFWKTLAVYWNACLYTKKKCILRFVVVSLKDSYHTYNFERFKRVFFFYTKHAKQESENSAHRPKCASFYMPIKVEIDAFKLKTNVLL